MLLKVHDYEPSAYIIALALDAAKEQTRRDTERETVEKAAKAVKEECGGYGPPGSRDCAGRGFCGRTIAAILRAFPLVPAPAAEKEKPNER